MPGVGAQGGSHLLAGTPSPREPWATASSASRQCVCRALLLAHWVLLANCLLIHGPQPDHPLSVLCRLSQSQQEEPLCLTGLSPGQGCWASSGL